MGNRQRYGDSGGDGLAVGLGWFSIGLGLAEVAAPRQLARLIGLRPSSRTDTMLQSFGAREIATGLAILSQPDNAMWMWGRVAGDAMDLVSLAAASGERSSERRRATLAALAVAGVTALDVVCAQRLGDSNQYASSPRDRRAARPATSIDQAVTINASMERVRTFCQSPDRLPASLKTLLEQESADSLMSFRAAPGNRGTEVRVHVPEAQARGVFNRLASVVGHDYASLVRDDLRKVKQLIEVGEVILSDGPSMRRPGQPAADPTTIRAAAGV